MRRYWLSFLLLMTPCVAVGAWAWSIYLQHLQEDAAALRASWHAQATLVASLSLTGSSASAPVLIVPAPATRLRQVVHWLEQCAPLPGSAALLLEHGQSRVPLATWAAALDGSILDMRSSDSRVGLDRQFPIAAGPLAQVQNDPQPDPALALARRLEFGVVDLPGALDAYHRLRLHAASVATAREATAGEISCLLGLRRMLTARERLFAALEREDIEPAVGAALTLDAIAGDATPISASLAARAWSRLLASGTEPTLQQQLREEVNARAAQLPRAERDRAQALDLLDDQDRRMSAIGDRFTADDRTWLAGVYCVPAGQVHHLDQGLFALPRPLSDGGMLISIIDQAQLATLIATRVEQAAVLDGLAFRYAQRFTGSIAQDASPIDIPLPWGGLLSVTLRAAQYPTRSWPMRHFPALGLGGCATCVILAGFLMLYRTARQDARLVELRAGFVSTVSHEMKTPLALIRMYAEMLELGYATSPPEQAKAHAVILSEAARLHSLVDRVLGSEAARQGTLLLRRTRCDLAVLAQQVIDIHRPSLEGRGFVLDADLPLPGPEVDADADAITRILVNLLENAAKYSRDERWIRVSVRCDPRWAVLEVADHGVGIAREHLGRIFERFYRVEAGLARDSGGLGLGLSLVRSLARAHGGDVTVVSRTPGGSCFSVRLPHAVHPPVVTGGDVADSARARLHAPPSAPLPDVQEPSDHDCAPAVPRHVP